jgi:very-short-patch-repair endonuclease
MDYQLRELTAKQEEIVAAWQLRQAGWTAGKVKHHARSDGWRRIHSGVYALGAAPLKRRQLWWAAALTSPDTVLSHGSAGACYGFYRFDRDYEVVTRPGQGGRRRHGALLVFRSTRWKRDVTRHLGIPIMIPERVLIDIAPGLNEQHLGRALREAIRLKATTAPRVRDALLRQPGRPGTGLLRALVTRYGGIPYARTRSNAESRALEVLHDAGLPAPRVNIRIAGEEADLVWLEERFIIEIDGPQYHLFAEEDRRKERHWRKAGYAVRRLPSAAVYDEPARLIALARGRSRGVGARRP